MQRVPEVVDELARLYAGRRSRDLLTQIVDLFQPNISSLAVRISRKNPVPTVLSAEDFWAAGYVGLMEALARYDPALNSSFIAWSSPRIRGAMVDAIRRASPTSRTRNVRYVAFSETIDPEDEDSMVQMESLDYVLSPEASQQLRVAITRLSGMQQSVLLLSLHGMTANQVSRLLSVRASAVRQHKDDAVASLRTALLPTLSSGAFSAY